MDQSRHQKIMGLVFGIIGGILYGMNPLFAKPLYGAGFTPDSVLFLRYFPAMLILGLSAWLRHETLKLNRREILLIIPEGLLFAVASLTLYQSYLYLDSGIASTILFVYPIMTAVVMWSVFHEKIRFETAGSLLLAIIGIGLLCRTPQGAVINLTGLALAGGSALTYAFYLVFSNKSALCHVSSSGLTFYTLLFGSILFAARIVLGFGKFGTFTSVVWGNIIALAILPTLLSLLFTNMAIRMIGSTITSILGALEPVTAVFFGILIFGEVLTVRIGTGIVITLIAVLLVIIPEKRKIKS